MTERDYHYLAGLFDGEGCLAISNVRRRGDIPYYQYRLVITNTSLRLLESVQREFGGKIWSGKQRHEPWQTQHQWVVWKSEEILEIFKGMRPYLRYKDHEADTAVRLLEGMADRRYPKGLPGCEQDRRWKYIRMIKAMRRSTKEVAWHAA